jgi:hypothetical protein
MVPHEAVRKGPRSGIRDPWPLIPLARHESPPAPVSPPSPPAALAASAGLPGAWRRTTEGGGAGWGTKGEGGGDLRDQR